MINFSPKAKFSDGFSNLWRNLLTLFLLFLGIITGLLYYKFDNERKTYLAEYFTNDKQVAGIKEENDDLALQVGGDVDFSLNKIITPKLNASSAPIDLEQFTASNILVKDKDSSVMLVGKNSYEKHSLASITKLMSGLVLLEQNLDWSATTTVSPDKVSGTNIYFGDTFTLDELWKAGFVASSNKAILTLVDASGLSRADFVVRMNTKAKELGMSDSNFVEPTGLDENNISTASDVAILLNEALEHDKIKDTLNLREATLYSKERKKEIHMWNTDWLLLGWIPNKLSIIGGKTGYIDDSLYNFTVAVKNDEGHVVDIVVLGASKHEFRFTEAKKIAEWVFANYTW